MINKFLITILEKIPKNCTPIIKQTSTKGIIYWDNGDIEYPGEVGWVCFFDVKKDKQYIKKLSLFIFENNVFYYIEDHIKRTLSEKCEFNLEEFVELFNV